MSFEEAAKDFLAQKRIAVVGLSQSKATTGNAIYKSLKEHGYELVPIHPTAESFEGDTCYPNLQAVPNSVDAVLVVTRPTISETILRDAVEAGVPRVWMHYNPFFGKNNSSVSHNAVDYGREHGIQVIDGGCPLMFLDGFHKGMRWVLGVTGNLPDCTKVSTS
jgi:hypothetical protein